MESRVKSLNSLAGRLRLAWWKRLWDSLPALRVRHMPRQLRLCESLSLGEKRLVAVIQYQGQSFLVGAGAQSVSLLSRLDTSAEFSELLTQWCERQR